MNVTADHFPVHRIGHRRFKTRRRPRPGLGLLCMLGMWLNFCGRVLYRWASKVEYLEHEDGNMWTSRWSFASKKALVAWGDDA